MQVRQEIERFVQSELKRPYLSGKINKEDHKWVKEKSIKKLEARYQEWSAKKDHSGLPFMHEKRHAKMAALVEKYIETRLRETGRA